MPRSSTGGPCFSLSYLLAAGSSWAANEATPPTDACSVSQNLTADQKIICRGLAAQRSGLAEDQIVNAMSDEAEKQLGHGEDVYLFGGPGAYRKDIEERLATKKSDSTSPEPILLSQDHMAKVKGVDKQYVTIMKQLGIFK